MRVETADFGEQDIDPETVLVFPEGIPGFENDNNFKLFREDGARQVYQLQSLDHSDVVFSVVLPDEMNVFYEFTLDDAESQLLECDGIGSIGVLILAYRSEQEHLGEPGNSLSFSFMHPLIINLGSRKGMMKTLSEAKPLVTIKAV